MSDFISIRITSYNVCYTKLLRETICKNGFENDQPVFIDAEESWIQDTIDRIVVDLSKKYNKEKAIVFNTLQMYRHDRLAYLKEVVAQAEQENWHPGFKIVRGAYMEKERERAQKMGYRNNFV